MVKKAYLYSKNNKLHRGYEDHSLLSIFSENLIVFWSNLIKRFRHKLKGRSANTYISGRTVGVIGENGRWTTSEAITLRISANNQKHR